jgi:tRNA (cmo5U34)-methyltransferase
MENNTSSWKNKNVVDSFLQGRRSAIPFASDQLKVLLHLLLHNEKPIIKFIDLGSGDGILSQLILEQFSEAQGYLIDFSKPMLDAAYNRLSNYLHRIKLINCDISNPCWQEKTLSNRLETVDAIVSGYTIHHLSHGRKYELYQEIYNNLSHNGIFINIEHVASKSLWGEMVSDELFINSILSFEETQGLGRTREQITKDFNNREDKKDNILLSVETQCNWLEEIGFQQVDIYFKSFELAVFAGKKL